MQHCIRGGITLLSFYIMQLPGLLYGRSLLDPIRIYISQAGYYERMWMNFPSFWCLLGDNYATLKPIAMLSAIGILGIGLLYLLKSAKNFAGGEAFMQWLIWTVWTCLLFLPTMHERYSYLLDVLLLIHVSVKKKDFPYAAAAVLCSVCTYGNYLFGNGTDLKFVSAVYVIAYAGFTYAGIMTEADKSREVERI